MVRQCPACQESDEEATSIESGKSGKSGRGRSKTPSRRPSRRPSTSGLRSSNTSSVRNNNATSRYDLPFDADGYCSKHPSVQIAQKKMGGGFQILRDCSECYQDEKEVRSRSESRSRTSSKKKKKKKKRIRVKNLKTDDGNGKVGRYSGYVNVDHIPNGDGVIKYSDGTEWEGEWSEGTQVEGELKRTIKEPKQISGSEETQLV